MALSASITSVIYDNLWNEPFHCKKLLLFVIWEGHMISGDSVQLKVVIKNVYFHLFNFYFACTNVLPSISVNQQIKFFRVKILKIMYSM